MNARPRRVVGALLAGGESRRMGRDKSSLVLTTAVDDGSAPRDETLAARAVRVLSSVAEEVVVLGHGRGVDPSLPRLEDTVAGIGPAAGLLALLESGRGDSYVVLPVDMPLVDAALLAELLAALDDAPAHSRAVTFTVDGRREPLPLVLRASARSAVASAVTQGERRLGRIIDELAPLHVPCRRPVLLQNINTSEDFQTIDGGPRHQ